MIKDYTAYQLTAHLQDIQALKAAEQVNDQHACRRLREKLAANIPAAAFHYLKATGAARSEEVRAAWQRRVLGNPGAAETMLRQDWALGGLADRLEKPDLTITDLPPLAFWLHFHFLLEKPFISKDEESFYMISNPVRKDKVLRRPYISPSTYKGALRSAGRYTLGVPLGGPDSGVLERLFGTDKRKKGEDLRQGRLWFFPTFFRQVGVEVINPHARKSGAGTIPISFETALGGGYFQLLYFPFDLAPGDLNEVADDIEAVAKALKAMLLTYGLAAKKTSGYGITRAKVTDFSWVVHYRPVQTPSKDHQATADLLRHEAAEFDLNDLPTCTTQMAERLRQGARR